MALRDENYLFTRRIADRGSDEIVVDSQDRKIQETDSKDVIWDEIVGKEEHPEDCDGYKFQETDSKAFIRDENCGKEEYSENCSVIYLSPPCFDEYEDEEWYFWVTGRNRNLPDDESGSKSRNVEGVIVVEKGGDAMVTGDDTMALGSSNAEVFDSTARVTHDVSTANDATSLSKPQIMDAFNVSSINKASKGSVYPSFKIQIITIDEFDAKPTQQMENETYFLNMGNIQKYVVGPFVGKFMDVRKASGRGMLDASQMTSSGLLEKQNDLSGINVCGPHMNKNYGPSFEFIVVHKMFEWVKLKVNNHAPFDLGGTSPDPDETTHEVEQFRRVVIIAQKIWVDVTFDPGGFGPKTKLEDEFFFSKRGRMMQATRTDPVIWNLTRDPARPARRPARIILYDLIF
ncbi:hypothetical protein HanRHA438_Chr13g0616121 [Helianthus annuus]|nr:hypothetical protein HanHA300_Chr13g0496621 [Helianthus annuus]KAJ0499000.1 hypothetical protein HanHA89_Chr13g0529271 [Helianthus annuus]KAJ0665014.1 hypothetical protein HanLR1_Chr13g0499301 [Helianthus annuus]KAJ0672438.1 hypothetical protein HanOQP8_Chr13g0497311 [Helianthus annuus]KAJ0859746.1 hypothetical protein HanRHA438_Chr13g0616121 [Helianthus annuus]